MELEVTVERIALDFEQPIVKLEQKIEELKQLRRDNVDFSDEIRELEGNVKRLLEQTYAILTPWQIVQLSRHPQRPYTLDYIGMLMRDFVELQGDRSFGDDAAIVGGFAYFGDDRLLILGHQKGRNTRENMQRNFGMPRPEGYRKAKRLMELAARMNIPILTLIDTPGAYPGIDAEERGQAEAIAKNLEVMARLPVPIISIVIGEGGSGGALALGVANRILMLEYSVYSVISPEGCASILWKDGTKAPLAAEVLNLRASDISRFDIVDEVIPEPLGGAHRNMREMTTRVGEAIRRHLSELTSLSREDIVSQRYDKFRQMGVFETL